ncbi:hypothetical protein M6D81_03990 [Paenibacillus sp. J5C_2022]|uniref:alpha-L-rhamnosidase-related protein n=1 Tax=Paenibacillus sp. J5C2022 TaxID=2977129 RepID=UPI0021D02F63|nr:hypothetical protein [Paenibacillus sp. J5C2022]MCU6707864.1 hypothetical protein [Paenibacillus sp. J5C2022]
MEHNFKRAVPVWITGEARTMNVSAGFIYSFTRKQGSKYRLNLTGSTLFRVYVNGRFFHYGPARGPHGYARIDELVLDSELTEGMNKLAIEVAGYNCYSYYTLNIPSFLQAEVYEDDRLIGYSDVKGNFSAVRLTTRVQKAMRYSFQRTFTEIYHLDHAEPLANWMTGEVTALEELENVALAIDYLARELPIPHYDIRYAEHAIEYGAVDKQERKGATYAEHRFIHQISDTITGYPLDEIEERPFELVQDLEFKPVDRVKRDLAGGTMEQSLQEGQYVLLDMGLNLNGFIVSEVMAAQDSEVYFMFDEKLIDGRIAIHSWDWINVLKYSLKQNERPYSLESFESYGFRYLLCYVAKGTVTLRRAGLREYTYPACENAVFRSGDEQLNDIFQAALETYRQNTLDVFMDCPTRERAGWLCDSYFTGQSAQYFSGDAAAEKVFLENFVLARGFPYLPKGMLPMCYPADHVNGRFIPQWAMWYVIELEGYLKRDAAANIDDFKALCYGLIHYFRPFRNEDGLLEKLDSWNFIEWSKANQWVQDVNYPTNMLYSKMLRLIGEWYKDDELKDEADRIRETIIEQSFNGEFFIDHAVREDDGSLRLTDHTSEVCQYYAFFFDIADEKEERFKTLQAALLDVFGPARKELGLLPEVAYANAFIGYYLRMELLLRWRRYAQSLNEVKGYFHHMSRLTGTLWEHGSVNGSLNHGFASFAGVVILKALLGIQEINEKDRVVVFDFADVPIEAELRLGTSLGEIRLKRELSDGEWTVRYSVPDGYDARKI